MFCLGSLLKIFLPWSCKHSPKLASQTFPCIRVSWRAHVSPAVWVHGCFLAPVVLTLLLWGVCSKNHGSRSFAVLAFAYISIIHQKLWSSSFHFSHMEIQVPFADQTVLSPLFCKPSVQKYMNLFLAPSVSTGLSLPWASPNCPVTATSMHAYDHVVSLHTHTHTHTHTLLEFSLKVN